jgi:hypothetical protein
VAMTRKKSCAASPITGRKTKPTRNTTRTIRS